MMFCSTWQLTAGLLVLFRLICDPTWPTPTFPQSLHFVLFLGTVRSLAYCVTGDICISVLTLHVESTAIQYKYVQMKLYCWSDN